MFCCALLHEYPCQECMEEFVLLEFCGIGFFNFWNQFCILLMHKSGTSLLLYCSRLLVISGLLRFNSLDNFFSLALLDYFKGIKGGIARIIWKDLAPKKSLIISSQLQKLCRKVETEVMVLRPVLITLKSASLRANVLLMSLQRFTSKCFTSKCFSVPLQRFLFFLEMLSCMVKMSFRVFSRI